MDDSHACMICPLAGFPRGLPDVGTDGTTGDPDNPGPFFHDCAVCGMRWILREVSGFVCWQPV